MKEMLIFLIILSSFISIFCQQDNPCTGNEDCGKCLRADGLCHWCNDLNWTVSYSQEQHPRCNYLAELKDCQNLTRVDGKSTKPIDNDFSPTIQVRPQKVNLELRPDQPVSFSVTVKPAENFPVYLYYLMDMSYSMKDDLDSLRTLGTQIATRIKTITKKYKLAFGSFVDKTVAPYVQVEKISNPCDGCEETFGFKHIFDFNDNENDFQKAVKNEQISGNLDTAEGVLDGLMQVAVCTNELKWPPQDSARRIVIVVTDASPHIAGDGKLGGILLPNDGKCHLGTNNMYTESNNQDYPSFSQLRTKLKENKIVPILAVTSDVFPIYKKLAEEWVDLGASIGKLSGNSDNIVDLIEENYRKIAQTVRFSDVNVNGLSVKYSPVRCRRPDGDSICREVGINGEEVEFKVTVTLESCPADEAEWDKYKNFTISIPGFGDVDVSAKLLCDCPCEKPGQGELDSLKCNGTGTFQCGICYCPDGRYGDQCECDGNGKLETTPCLQGNETEIVCNGVGDCICGKCVCNRRTDPKEIISGTYCQCNNFGCDRYKREECGGPTRGECECGLCKCKNEFIGDNCGEVNCTIAEKKCNNNNMICSENGRCDCGTCVCDKGYEGTYCENCVSCPGKCKDHKDCVFCQVYDKGPKDVCDQCNLNIKLVDDVEELCVYEDDDGCYVTFNYEQNLVGNETILVRREKRCAEVITRDVNILAIVLGVIGGILLVGLLLLILWKFCITAYDRHEYMKFEKDRMRSKWEKNKNPLYKPSKQQFQNPTYAGDK